MSDLIKRIDAAIRACEDDTPILKKTLTDCKAEIERLSKPYTPIPPSEYRKYIDTAQAHGSANGWNMLDKLNYLIESTQAAVIARYNEQRGVK